MPGPSFLRVPFLLPQAEKTKYFSELIFDLYNHEGKISPGEPRLTMDSESTCSQDDRAGDKYHQYELLLVLGEATGTSHLVSGKHGKVGGGRARLPRKAGKGMNEFWSSVCSTVHFRDS